MVLGARPESEARAGRGSVPWPAGWLGVSLAPTRLEAVPYWKRYVVVSPSGSTVPLSRTEVPWTLVSVAGPKEGAAACAAGARSPSRTAANPSEIDVRLP